MGGEPGRYRTKIEVLRDVVRAASTEQRKTRIIGMANLNHGSFRRYSELGVSLGLLRTKGTGLVTTPVAKEWLIAVDGILAKSTELSRAIDTLSRLTPPPSDGNDGRARGRAGLTAVQLMARLAWADVRPTEVGDELDLSEEIAHSSARRFKRPRAGPGARRYDAPPPGVRP